MEPVMRLLETDHTENKNSWEVDYVLLLWMSMLVLIPFDMARFDSTGEESKVSVTSFYFI